MPKHPPLLLAVWCLSVALLSCTRSRESASLTPVRVGLDFTVSGYHAPWFVAQEKGYFRAEALEVSINRGLSSGDTVKKLTTGVIDAGFAHPAHVIQAVAQGEGLKIVMGYFVNEMCTIYSYAEKGNVTRPGALEGKRWGAPAGDVCALLLEPLAEAAGFDAGQIRFINMDAPSRIPALVEGHIDATGSFYDKDFLFERAGRQAGLTMRSVRLADHLSLYSNSVLAGEALLRDNPNAVRGLVRALLRGLAFTLENPDEAARIVLERKPELDPGYVRAAVAILPEATRDDAAPVPGALRRDQMAATIAVVARQWKIQNPPSAEQVYTNEFVLWASRNPR